MDNKLLQALIAHYNARIQRAEANMVNYFKNSVGVGEHPDIVGELVKLVDQIAASKGSLEILQSYVQPADQESSDAEKPAEN